jgi:hypothetical protein
MMIEYPHHSPSSLNLFAAAPAMWVMEKLKGIKQPVGAVAHRGVAVEHGVAHGLLHPKTMFNDAIKIARTKYDTLTALSGDARRDEYRKDIPDMVVMAIEELRDYGVPTSVQGYITWKPPELRLPIVGYYDFRWDDLGIVDDLKTTNRMPNEIKIAHARQVSLYTASDNMQGRLTYVTPKKCQTYELENIREHRQALLNVAIIVENLLSMSDDPDFFMKMFAPDLDSFYWTSPAARQLAFEHWRI